ncbi:amidohydrolase family protein [Glaciibacter superstes]|uniref:amidohydrolase family protein n=1 Tax=Glaciibacter superstes TaxID=501023 RepID=UPI000422EE76|nr:amidohydrolase family protein [Glaciibacter superstes]
MSTARVVDVHSHVIPPVLLQAMREGTAPDGITIEDRESGPWVIHRQGYQYPLLGAFHDVAARLTAMDEAGVDVALISAAPPLFLYWIERENARAASVVINDAIVAMVKEAPDRFAGLATLPMQDPEAAAEELRRCVQELGMKGAQIGPHIEGTPLDSPELRPVLETAAELGVPLVVHPYYVGSAPDLDDFYLTNLQGNPWQIAVCASRLIFSGVLDELPELNFVLVHGGGHLPYQIGRLDHGHRVRPEAKLPKLAPSEYLRRFHYDSLTHDAKSTKWLTERVGADRVMYGSDMPFDMAGGPFDDQLANVPDEDARRLIAWSNAAQLFHLDD